MLTIMYMVGRINMAIKLSQFDKSSIVNCQTIESVAVDGIPRADFYRINDPSGIAGIFHAYQINTNNTPQCTNGQLSSNVLLWNRAYKKSRVYLDYANCTAKFVNLTKPVYVYGKWNISTVITGKNTSMQSVRRIDTFDIHSVVGSIRGLIGDPAHHVAPKYMFATFTMFATIDFIFLQMLCMRFFLW